MKPLLFVFLFLLQNICVNAQSGSKYDVYTNKIKQFSQPSKVLSNNIKADGNGSIEFTNAKKQVLRFRVMNHKLQVLHGEIAFQLFYYDNIFLQRVETFDKDGSLAGERESNNEAAVVFIIEKPGLYLKKKKLIDAAEGNINLKDDSNEKIIRVQFYDSNNLPIPEIQHTYISSKTYWNQNIRMNWP